MLIYSDLQGQGQVGRRGRRKVRMAGTMRWKRKMNYGKNQLLFFIMIIIIYITIIIIITYISDKKITINEDLGLPTKLQKQERVISDSGNYFGKVGS